MPGKQYIFVITLFQSIVNIWNMPGSEMDLVLDNSLHYWFALDLLMVLFGLLSCSKAVWYQLTSIKKGETATQYFLRTS